MPAGPGRIELIVGCMFSGKTCALFERLGRAEALGLKVRLFKHVIDVRDGAGWVAAHSGLRHPATEVAGAEVLEREAAGCDLAAVDEGHFFEAALLESCRRLAARGMHVLVAALDLDCWGRPFPVVTKLRDLADEVSVLHATCARCGELADRTHRLTPIVGGDLIGGAEAYEARCARCFRPGPAGL